MKQSPELSRIQENMKPGQLTAHGFIGDDDRNVADIINEDNRIISAQGRTNKMIADRMRYFTETAQKEFGNQVAIEEIYLVAVDDSRGFMPCPFQDNFKAAKRNTQFENTKLKKTIYWSDLNIHMIEAHGFYEGKGSFFRVEAEEIAELLGI